MTFGYDSGWAFSRSVAGIEEFALDLLNRIRYKRWSAKVELLLPVVATTVDLSDMLISAQRP